MKLTISPENFMERIALLFNLIPLPLMDTQVAFTGARTIMAAADTGIFEALGKTGKTLEEVADKCHTHPAATQQLLNCLTGLGYLRWKNGKYFLKSRYYKWLLQEYPSNFIGKLRFQISEWNWMAYLETYVRSGKPIELHKVLTESEWASYQDGMRDLSVNTAQELAGKIKIPPGATKMLDIGGSHGLYSIELCKKQPALSSTILELPGAVDRASAIAARHGLTERVRYQAGNALTDELGEGEYDLIMINNVVHHFTEAENLHLAQKVTRALKPGGMYAVGEFIRSHYPGEGGAVAAGAGLYFSLTSASGTWSVEEINGWQQKVGLKPQKPVSLLSLPGWKSLVAVKQIIRH